MNVHLDAIVRGPRCHRTVGAWLNDYRCSGCAATFPVQGDVPLMTSGIERSARMDAEWKAQRAARTLYVDPQLTMNLWERLVVPALDVDGRYGLMVFAAARVPETS